MNDMRKLMETVEQLTEEMADMSRDDSDAFFAGYEVGYEDGEIGRKNSHAAYVEYKKGLLY